MIGTFSHKAVLSAESARTLNSKSASIGVRLVVVDDSFLKDLYKIFFCFFYFNIYSVGVQSSVVVVNEISLLTRVGCCSINLSSFSPPSKIGINLICD